MHRRIRWNRSSPVQRVFIPDRRRDGDLTGAISTIEKKALSPCKRIVFADRASGQECRFCLLTSKQRTAASLLINDAWRHACLAAWLLQHAIPLGARLSHRSDLQRTNRPRSSQTVEKPPINDQGIDTKARYTPPLCRSQRVCRSTIVCHHQSEND